LYFCQSSSKLLTDQEKNKELKRLNINSTGYV
jgi:hypothetical protein